jgi:hypothetical protein
MPEVMRLCNYWREHPPLHILLAAWLGYDPKSELTSEQVGELASYLGPTQKPPGYISDLMGWAEKMKARMGRA